MSLKRTRPKGHTPSAQVANGLYPAVSPAGKALLGQIAMIGDGDPSGNELCGPT